MAQLTIYLDAKTQKIVEAAAAREAVSVSRWARERLKEAVQRRQKRSPLSDFYGAIADETFGEPGELRRSADARRESFD